MTCPLAEYSCRPGLGSMKTHISIIEKVACSIGLEENTKNKMSKKKEKIWLGQILEIK